MPDDGGRPQGDALSSDLDEALAAYAFIVETSDDAIYRVSHDGLVTSWNPAAARMSGYPGREAIGSEPTALFPDHRQPEERQVLRRALCGERIERRETELLRRDGLLVPVELTVAPLRGRDGTITGAFCIAHDITEQRLAQDYLAESQARLSEAQQLAKVGMWTWDRATEVVQYSEPLYHLLELEPDALEGTMVELIERVRPDDRGRVEAILRDAIATGSPVNLDCGVRSGRGAERWVSLRAEAVLDSGGEVVGLRGIVQDITDRHAAELAIREALDREREAVEQLREADRLKDEFLSTVSHELRTPLTVIAGLSSLLVARRDLDETAPDLIERIQRNAEEMRGMIDRLLDYSRLEAGRVVAHPTAIDLAIAVARAVRSTEAQLSEHQVSLDVEPGSIVHADEDALARVLANLLTNAAKFSPPGSTIHIGARPEGDEVVLTVRDEGSGIEPAQQEHVFERFFQVERDQRAGRRGAGVGLSIVRRYLEMQGGRVWLESAPGAGSTFFVALPRPPAGGR